MPVMCFSAQPFWRQAWHDLRQRRIGMDVPIALGMALTFVVSTAATLDPLGPLGREVYFDSLTMFVFLILGGRLLQWRMQERTAGALDALMNRWPESALRQSPKGWQRVALHHLQVGDVVRVGVGETFAEIGRAHV